MKKKKEFNLWTKVRSALRKVWMYSPQRRETLGAAKYGNEGFYLCVLCKAVHPKYAMDVDHIVPCGTLKALGDLEGFFDRLFNGKLQAICKNCHALKTKKKTNK